MVEEWEQMQTTDSEKKAYGAEGSRVRPSKRDTSHFNEWQQFFLDRLETLLARQYQLTQKSDFTDEQRKLVSKAVYSTFLDCQAQGIGDVALQQLSSQGSRGPSSN
ncbi:MAG: hypothetical protein KGJ86_09990 [Chloroflexota bacterium]|nr:hypothetical protein [Chloroflexota bacterium]